MDFLLCVCLLISLGTKLASSTDRIIMNIKQGQIKGKRLTTRGGRTIYGYLGIPYAQPPVGELRFKPPEWPMKWNGVRDATKDGPPCVQNNLLNYKERNVTFGNEDCLYLNVFAPEPPETGLLTVMMYIHGGGFFSGSSSSELYGPDYLLDFDVILVVINYRLGALGFLSTEDNHLPGNYGLKDQREALGWIQRNILTFGGDKRSVTIFGSGAGAASVHLHMISPISRRLFHAAISQSGTALCQWSVNPPGYSKNAAHRVAREFGCPTNDSVTLAECLRKVPAKDITSVAYTNLDFDRDPAVLFAPTIEGDKLDAIISDDPWKNNSHGAWIIGVVSQEGAMRVSSLTRGKEGIARLEKLSDELKHWLPTSLLLNRNSNHPQAVAKKVWKFYFGDVKISKKNIQPLINMYSDSWFTYCTSEALKRHMGSAYQYYLSYKGNKSMSSFYGNDKDNLGVCHGDELIYLFPMTSYFPNRTDTEDDIEFSQNLVELWTNFARTKRPTPRRSPRNHFTIWRPLSNQEKKYLNMNTRYRMTTNWMQHRLDFWANLPFRNKPKPEKVRQY